MSEARLIPLFGTQHDVGDRSNAVDAIDAGLAALYPHELYPAEEEYPDAEIADEISLAVYRFFGMAANDIDMEALTVFRYERARDMLQYIASRALDTEAPGTIEQIARLQRLVGAETGELYIKSERLAPVVPLRPAQ